jgi:hypothetical protein
MAIYHGRLCRFVWHLLALVYCSAASQLTFPAMVEADLIFPRNDTYATTRLMPVVFAIQNAKLAYPLDIGFSWNLWPVSGSANATVPKLLGLGTLDLSQANLTSNSPFYAFGAIDSLAATGGTWALIWTISWGNCSGGLDQMTASSSNTSRVIFTTNNGGSQPDLVAATADGTCTSSESFTFNVTGTENVGYPPDYDARTSCAVLPTTLPSPAPNPCGARVDASAASSISAALTGTACGGSSSAPSCPPSTTAKSAGHKGAQFPVGTLGCLIALGWLLVVI